MMPGLVRLAAIVAAAAACIVYPFLPGSYDALAMPLSTVAQALALLGTLLLAPIGALWLGYELRQRARRGRGLAAGNGRFGFGVAAAVAGSIVTLAGALVGWAVLGPSLAVAVAGGGVAAAVRAVPGLRRMRGTEPAAVHPLPAWLLAIPVATLAFQLAVAGPATDASRRRTAAGAGELIGAIEQYHAREGSYPSALGAVWKDYHPGTVGVERFHYAARGESYDLFFEQPRFLLDDIGTREFVVYNPRDEQRMISHTAAILLADPDQLAARQGWYAVRDGPGPHWKSFSFD